MYALAIILRFIVDQVTITMLRQGADLWRQTGHDLGGDAYLSDLEISAARIAIVWVVVYYLIHRLHGRRQRAAMVVTCIILSIMVLGLLSAVPLPLAWLYGTLRK